MFFAKKSTFTYYATTVMLYSPKRLNIFGVICIVAGILIWLLWDVVDLNFEIRGTSIIEWSKENLGRNGISAFYVIGGLAMFLLARLRK